jgi:hypothetical protein
MSSSTSFSSAAAWVAAALAALLLTGLALSWATQRLDYSEPKLRESLAFRGEKLDVVFLGNSLTLEGVSPRRIDSLLGTRSYNFALGGASLLESELQLRHFLESNAPPRLVALGLYLDAPDRYAGISPTLYYALEAPLRGLFWQRSGGVDESFVVFNRLAAYRYRNTLDLALKYLATREDTRPRFVQGQAQASFSREVAPPGAHRAELDAGELRSFLSFCAERSLPVYLFEPPLSPGRRADNRAEVLAEVSEIVAHSPNVSFQSFADQGNAYLASDWVNLNHLNERGAEKFSETLAAALRSHL